MENRKTEYRKYALYTFLTLMIELSIASLMDMLLSKFGSFYSAAAMSLCPTSCGITEY